MKPQITSVPEAQQNHALDGYVDAPTCLNIIFPDNGISLRLFHKLQAQGHVPYLKLGRRCLYSPAEVRAALEKRLKRKAVA